MLHLVILLSAAAPAAPDAVPALLPPLPPLARSVGWSPPWPDAPAESWLVVPDLPPPVSTVRPTREPPPSGSPRPPEAEPSFESVLDEAKRRYFQGETDHARALLEGLQLRLYAGEQPEWSLVVDALIYLGEIYYGVGLHDQAQIAFRYLLERDPDTPISPFHHTMDLVNLFELVRTTVRADRADEVPPPVEPSPLPAWAFLPFGVPQLLQGRTAAGLGYGLLQLGLGAASIGLFVNVARLNPEDEDAGDDHPLWGRYQIPGEIDRLKYTMQWPATFGFYGLWGISFVDAAVWHARNPDGSGRGRGNRRGDAALPSSGGPVLPLVQVRGRF
jgi:tetratricopeptide (TPR) repeat protein